MEGNFICAMQVLAATFPLHLWCQAIPQAERQLFLLRKSCVHPMVSEYDQVYGRHNYNAEPFIPTEMETLVHENPKRRDTFAEHCRKGYIIGKSFEHYCAWTMWVKDIRATRISATVFHKHKYITNPSVTPEEPAMATSVKLAAELKGHMATNLSKTALHQLE